jgi:hypothetical protein
MPLREQAHQGTAHGFGLAVDHTPDGGQDGKFLLYVQDKLGNENFVRNAPPEVVATDRARVAEFEAQKSGLASQLARVRRMGPNGQ